MAFVPYNPKDQHGSYTFSSRPRPVEIRSKYRKPPAEQYISLSCINDCKTLNSIIPIFYGNFLLQTRTAACFFLKKMSYISMSYISIIPPMLRRHLNVIIMMLFHRVQVCNFNTSLCGNITRLQIFALKCDIYKVNEAMNINCSPSC